MKLTYRGISYNYEAPQVKYGDVYDDVLASGKYRGLDVRFWNRKKVPVYQPTLDLIYRGAAYQTGKSNIADTNVDATADTQKAAAPASIGAASVSEVTQKVADTASSVQAQARSLMMDHHRSIKRRQQDMLGRLAQEVGLGSDAVDRWNLIQGKIHPTFRASYDRSKAAMS
ncbi:MAG: DUF4278 domain-containing protein [Elainellaceae cyanobacterium]